ncbi:MAG: hypothetical protein QMD77_01200 [Patescibacteria group bacterium]|nr:hypothetical protein [Patescibacteria group bacterium]
MKTNKKIFAAFLAIFFLAPAFSLAADAPQNAGDPSFYSLSVFWNSESNALSLNGDVSLAKQNLLKDTGSGSQFYARVINFNNKPEAFRDGNYKIFLGKWKLDGSSKKGELKITVPYFANGNKVIIFNAENKKVALTVDVSKMAKVKNSSGSAKAAKTVSKAPTALPAKSAVTYQIGGHSAAYWWTMRAIVLLVLAGIGYFIYRWRKKKKTVQAKNPVVNPMQDKK